jgi:ABC-2 type transport system ATP-binding protein
VATREVHDLLASLRERGVTIFLTTHRLEEAERLCHRVAILNTTLRLIGRPDELRQQLFSRSLDVRLRAPLDDPQAVLGAVPEVEGWEQTPAGYTLTVSDPDLAAPALSLNVIKVSTALALGLATALLAVDLLAWRVVAAMFDRERLVTGRPR